jgi:hypothetical protein
MTRHAASSRITEQVQTPPDNRENGMKYNTRAKGAQGHETRGARPRGHMRAACASARGQHNSRHHDTSPPPRGPACSLRPCGVSDRVGQSQLLIWTRVNVKECMSFVRCCNASRRAPGSRRTLAAACRRRATMTTTQHGHSGCVHPYSLSCTRALCHCPGSLHLPFCFLRAFICRFLTNNAVEGGAEPGGACCTVQLQTNQRRSQTAWHRTDSTEAALQRAGNQAVALPAGQNAAATLAVLQ